MLGIPFYVFGLLLALAILADVITTHIGVKLGTKEANPLFSWFKYPSLLVLLVGIAIVGTMWWVSPYEPFKASLFCLVFGIYRGYFAYRNYRTIQKVKKG
jgi:hypothetical protein